MKTIESVFCSLPGHGLETAPAECCRPSSPGFQENPVLPPRAQTIRLAFWRDLAVWLKAARNTRNCLIGCSIGDFAVLIYMQAYHPHAPMWLTMGLAMAAGLLTSILFESAILRFTENFRWRTALNVAFSMSVLSMVGMEFAANLTDFMLTGGKVPLSDPFYWVALGLSLTAGFLAPLPYNYYKFKRHGKACH